MRILRVIPSMDPITGGPCEGVRNSIAELKKIGVTNEVISMDNPDAHFINVDDFSLHAVGPGKSVWNYTSLLTPWLEKNINRFDAVIVHGLWLYHSYATQVFFRRFKRVKRNRNQIPRLYVMPHGMLDPYFQNAPERKLKAIRNMIYWKLAEQKTINKADGLLFTCESELELARESFHPYFPKREINIGYGIVEPPAFTLEMRKAFLEKCPSLQNHPYILFLGRIHHKKGVDLLIKAYKYFAEDIIISHNDNVLPRLVIAGPGIETPYGKEILKSISESELLKRYVRFAGMLTGDAKWGAFYGCDAFVLPSHQENFGIAVAEAMACGKPVLISNKVNIWNHIITSNAGIVADDTLNGTQELLQRWNNLSLDKKKAMGKHARLAFEKYFAASTAAKNLLDAIREE